ncbi:DUF6807 family protein, partial [Streptomyces aureus]|uniref:DUF6807 family protein n=1 Tax=Streptomyces aureus TaxID=193461 RepID=UPI000A781863
MTPAPPKVLRCAGRAVAHYTTRPGLAPRHSPRPARVVTGWRYGRPVTETAPEDHPHHLGVGVAVPDLPG